MTDINALFPSNYLKKEDLPQPTLVTITGVKVEDVSKDNEPTENKPIVYFQECAPLVLNKVNAGRITYVLGTGEVEQWTGKQITLFNDPTVEFGGKMIGGIRVQMPPAGTPMAPPQQIPPSVPEPLDDSVPF